MIPPHRARKRGLLALVPIVCLSAAHADVTMEQRMQVEGAGLMKMINMSGNTVTSISGERSRTDSDFRMESRLMRMFGGGATAEIVRLDDETLYQLDLKKKTFAEVTFAEQKAAMDQSIEQMREAQESQQQDTSGIDESSCQWSEPTATVDRSGETDTIAGYRAERMKVTASQSCADPQTGQVCSYNLILDQWLAPEFEAGDEVAQYYQAYAQKLGLDVAQSPAFAQRLESMFGGYQGIWGEIAAKMQDAEGYPLRSAVTLAVGGPQCQSAEEAQTAERSAPGVGEAVGGALGGALGGFLGRRRDAARKAEAAAEPAAPAGDAMLPDGTMKLMSITSELVSVSSDEVDPSAFEVPAGFRKRK
jgi:hypothetical protein